MKVTDIIIILLFIIPGVIVEKISYSLDMPSSDKRSEFRELINGILLSLPILITVGAVMCIINKIYTLIDLTNHLNDIIYISIFGSSALLISVMIGVLKGLYSDKITNLINRIRGYRNKIEIDNKSCWRKMFLDDPDCHYVEVIKDGIEYSGFTRWYSLPNEDKEIVLYIPDFLKERPEFKEKFKLVKQTYVNIEKNIVIKDYDMSEYNKWCDSPSEDI